MRRSICLGLMVVVLGAAGAAQAATVVIDGDATLASGQGRNIGASWAGGGPYRVSFQCGVPGCANFSSASTSSVSLARHVVRTTCTGETRTHTLTVIDRTGSRGHAQSQTRWLRGSGC